MIVDRYLELSERKVHCEEIFLCDKQLWVYKAMSVQERFEVHVFMLIEKFIFFLVLVEVVAWMPEFVSVIA